MAHESWVKIKNEKKQNLKFETLGGTGVIGHPDFRNESSRVDQPGTEDQSEVPYTLPGTNKKTMTS